MTQITLRHGIFLPPFHPMEENPTACLDRDLELMVWLDRLGFHVRLKTADRVRGARIAFLLQARSVADTRKIMEQMVRLARESA